MVSPNTRMPGASSADARPAMRTPSSIQRCLSWGSGKWKRQLVSTQLITRPLSFNRRVVDANPGARNAGSFHKASSFSTKRSSIPSYLDDDAIAMACAIVQSGHASVERDVFTLGHPVEHVGCHAVAYRAATEESLEIVDDHVGNLVTHLAIRCCNVGRQNRTRQLAQRMADGQRFQRVGDVESAAQALALDFTRKRVEIDQAAAGDVDDNRIVRQACEPGAVQKSASFVG